MKVEFRIASREEAGVTLRRTSRELRKAVGLIEDLEQVIGMAVALAHENCAEELQELQQLDHIQQKILGVADFLDALAGCMPSDWLVDAKAASRGVLLAELGARLGDSELPGDGGAPGSAETYELF